VNTEVHVLRGVDNYINKLHARNHKVNVEILFVRVLSEVVHERFEPVNLLVSVLEVVEGAQDNTVSTVYQTHGRQQFQDKRLGAVLTMLETESDRVDSLLVADDHVKAVLVVHDRAQTPHTLVHVLDRFSHPQLLHALACVLVSPGGTALKRRCYCD